MARIQPLPFVLPPFIELLFFQLNVKTCLLILSVTRYTSLDGGLFHHKASTNTWQHHKI